LANSKRIRDLFFNGIISDMGKYYERDQRIMREALIIVGNDIVSPIMKVVISEPIRYFNATEVLGFISGSHAWKALVELHRSVPDGWATCGILESMMRKIEADSQPELANDSLIDALRSSCVQALELAVVRRIKHSLNASEAKRLNSLRPDFMQLDVRPMSVSKKEIINDLSNRFGRALERQNRDVQIPAYVPGLDKVVHDALFATDRSERVLNGVLLTPWVGSVALTDAVGESVQLIPTADYGTQRSMVRFATKLGTANLNGHLRKLASSSDLETNTSVSIAWALGAGSETADEEVLKKMYESAKSMEVKRAVCTAALRRKLTPLIKSISHDRDGTVAREAMIALSVLDLDH
jgi:hypothetical protein